MSKSGNAYKVSGIIAEYNPFHNGHKYHLDDAKTQTGADYTVIAMSGNFMQRGTPALLDKYCRAEMALRSGADLVLEVPAYYAASSAEYFASGGVALLDKLGVVDHLCFGSECGDIEILRQIADILLEEPAEFVSLLKENLHEGFSYPIARTSALLQYRPELSAQRDVLSSANNILAIEYLKALKRRNSSMQPVTTRRSSSDYHDRMLGVHQSSALAIRQAVYDQGNLELLAGQFPDAVYELFSSHLKARGFLTLNDFSAALQYKLLMEKDAGYTDYLDVSRELSDRIRNNLFRFDSFRGFCDLLKTKEMTYTRISRCLLHILLNIKTDDVRRYTDADYVGYARVLGFRKSAEPLLSAIKEHSSIPLVTKLADAENILNGQSLEMLKRELCINSVYAGTAALKNGQPMENEIQTPLVII